MQIPILSGIYTSENADYRQQYPHNMIPVPLDQGITPGYLRPADGVSYFPEQTPPANQYGSAVVTTVGLGDDRGAVNWRDICYRVMADNLCIVDANGFIYPLDKDPAITVSGSGHCTMTYSFLSRFRIRKKSLSLWRPGCGFSAQPGRAGHRYRPGRRAGRDFHRRLFHDYRRRVSGRDRFGRSVFGQ